MIQQQQQQTPPAIWSNNNTPKLAPNTLNLTAQIEAINGQQMKLKEQIIQSENNLQAQHQV